MIIVKIIRNILNFFDNFHQNKIIKLISTKFDDKIVIIDVGAHFGETIKKFRNKLSVKKIYSFEASPINFKELKNNTKKYNPTKVEIFNYGLGENNFDGFINQTIESSSSTINRINTNSQVEGDESLTIGLEFERERNFEDSFFIFRPNWGRENRNS